MISQKDMLDIIATEAVEGVCTMRESSHAQSISEVVGGQKKKNDPPAIVYDLRLIRSLDGRFEWRD